MEVNVHQAKTHLAELLRRVVGDDEVTICRAGVPMARLVAAEPLVRPRPVGMYRDKFKVPDDFDASLPDDLLAQYYAEIPKPVKRAGKKPRRRRAA